MIYNFSHISFSLISFIHSWWFDFHLSGVCAGWFVFGKTMGKPVPTILFLGEWKPLVLVQVGRLVSDCSPPPPRPSQTLERLLMSQSRKHLEKSSRKGRLLATMLLPCVGSIPDKTLGGTRSTYFQQRCFVVTLSYFVMTCESKSWSLDFAGKEGTREWSCSLAHLFVFFSARRWFRWVCDEACWVQELFLSMDHPRVARLLDVYESEGRLSLVMECMEGGLGPLVEAQVFTVFGCIEAPSTHVTLEIPRVRKVASSSLGSWTGRCVGRASMSHLHFLRFFFWSMEHSPNSFLSTRVHWMRIQDRSKLSFQFPWCIYGFYGLVSLPWMYKLGTSHFSSESGLHRISKVLHHSKRCRAGYSTPLSSLVFHISCTILFPLKILKLLRKLILLSCKGLSRKRCSSHCLADAFGLAFCLHPFRSFRSFLLIPYENSCCSTHQEMIQRCFVRMKADGKPHWKHHTLLEISFLWLTQLWFSSFSHTPTIRFLFSRGITSTAMALCIVLPGSNVKSWVRWRPKIQASRW